MNIFYYKYLKMQKTNQEQQKPFGKLFNSIDIHSEEHLDLILSSIDKSSATFIVIQALKFAHQSGVYTMGESEVLSKCIRILSKQEQTKED